MWNLYQTQTGYSNRDEEFEIHKSREEKQRDKEKVLNSESFVVYTVDVQGVVLLLPNINSSLAYYKTILKVHNYTIYNWTNAEVNCFVWHEANGNLDSDVFASILFKFLKEEIENKSLTQVTAWSDGCSYQNLCEKVSNALLHISKQTNVLIQQKYLFFGKKPK